MGVSSSSLLDESKSNQIRGQVEAELSCFSHHYKRQYFVAFFNQLRDEVEQRRSPRNQLLKQREPPKLDEILYAENVLHFDEARKWKEKFVVVHGDNSLECYDSREAFSKAQPTRCRLLPVGGTVLTSEAQYLAMVDKSFPFLDNIAGVKEELAPPVPGKFPVYLRLPHRRDSYFCFHEEEQQSNFISILTDCIRHQNHDFLMKTTHEVQAFLKAIQFYRQEKGHYESWEILIGTDVWVLTSLVMDELLPSMEADLRPRLKGRKTDRKKVWFATVEAAHLLVQEQLQKGFASLKEECQEKAARQEALIRSDMDQIAESQAFLEGKLKATVVEPAVKYCQDNVQPYLASILEELMGPISSGFQEVRLVCERQMDRLCRDFQERSGGDQELRLALERMGQTEMQGCYKHVDALHGQLQELRSRFEFPDTQGLVHRTQIEMQKLMKNVAYTFELLLNATLTDNPGSAMEKAKRRVLKQYDYDSNTVRKRIFQKALVDITLPAIKKNLASTCQKELQSFDQYIFADYTNFIQVENVYEDILLQISESEVNKVVKEAANLKKHNLFVDSADQRFVSQSSLGDSYTPPRSAPSSPAKVTKSATQPIASPILGNGLQESKGKGSAPCVTTEDAAEKASASRPGVTDKEEKPGSVETGKVATGETTTSSQTENPVTDDTTTAPEVEKETTADTASVCQIEKVASDVTSCLAGMEKTADAEATAIQSPSPSLCCSTDTPSMEDHVLTSNGLKTVQPNSGNDDASVFSVEMIKSMGEASLCTTAQVGLKGIKVSSMEDVEDPEAVSMFLASNEDNGVTVFSHTEPAMVEVTEGNACMFSHPPEEPTGMTTVTPSTGSIAEVCQSNDPTAELAETNMEADPTEAVQPTAAVTECGVHSCGNSTRLLWELVRAQEHLETPAPDSVKVIRDLVVEIVEVEELVKQNPDDNNP